MKKQRARRPELLSEIDAQFTRAFTQKGMPEGDAILYAGVAVETLVYLLGGQHIYFPFGHLERTDQLHEQIRRDFTGDNHAELVAKYRKSFANIYSILRSQKGKP